MGVENINMEELEKQRSNSIKAAGQYCEVDLLIGKGEKTPIAHIAVRSVTPVEVALLLVSMKELEASIARRYPLASKIAENFEVDTIEIDGNGKELK